MSAFRLLKSSDLPLDLQRGRKQVFSKRLHSNMQTLDHLESILVSSCLQIDKVDLPIESILLGDLGQTPQNLLPHSRIGNQSIESLNIGRRDRFTQSLFD